MRWTSIALLAVAASACDSPSPTQNSDRIEDPNVTVLSGAEVVTTDTAVLVNGDARAFFQPPPYDLDDEVVSRASAVFMLNERTNRVVIPASALADVASHLPLEQGGFVFRIHEYLVQEDLLEIHRLRDGMTEPLNLLQSNGVGFYVRMMKR
jgi:hypothetical protein